MAGLSLYDMSDPELLARVKDVADKDGWVSTPDLAEALGYAEDDLASVVTRMSWMKRYGVVDRDNQKTKNGEKNDNYAKWRLTDLGEAAIAAKFNKGQANTLQAVGEEQLWLVSQFLTERYERTDQVYANLVRRQLNVGFRKRR